jgi:mannose/cellobiose epimerase-like protein (N-acyl-D-glucosamine 2-epimerase family)
VPAPLQGATWLAHLADDLLPYWTMPAALGDPVGNFPTKRGMDGRVLLPAERRPRMIARQVYVYSMAFLLTGDATLLGHARAGTHWLIEHGQDPRGGCHARLTIAGDAAGADPKTAQDTAYCALGPAAYFFVTRDPDAEAFVLGLRDLLFDPEVFWDAANGRIRDAVSADLSAEEDVEGDGGWELVAQLDPINAFLLLVQPVLTQEVRRTQALADLQTLGDTLVAHFLDEPRGVFWGVHNAAGRWGSKHADFGHTLKAWWMLLQLDKRLPAPRYREALAAHVHPLLALAYDDANGRWGKRITAWPAGGAPQIEWGSDWWSYAEADQLALTVNLLGGAHDRSAWLVQTQAHWTEDYVDRTRPAREVVPSVGRDGGWVWSWQDADDAKCNPWKNGYHSVEHALVSYLHGRWREGAAAELHFAVPAAQAAGFVATPYVFQGRETGRQDRGEISVGGAALEHVVVTFDDLY